MSLSLLWLCSFYTLVAIIFYALGRRHGKQSARRGGGYQLPPLNTTHYPHRRKLRKN